MQSQMVEARRASASRSCRLDCVHAPCNMGEFVAYELFHRLFLRWCQRACIHSIALYFYPLPELSVVPIEVKMARITLKIDVYGFVLASNCHVHHVTSRANHSIHSARTVVRDNNRLHACTHGCARGHSGCFNNTTCHCASKSTEEKVDATYNSAC